MDINKYLTNLVEETSKELLKIYFDNTVDRKTKLIFPKIRKEEKRISEQEMRFTFLNLHEKDTSSNLTYSVETPTDKLYSFTGKGKRRASTDVTFYQNNGKVLNMEFKAHNAKQDSISKDIEKLVRENCDGAWIQILKNENNDT